MSMRTQELTGETFLVTHRVSPKEAGMRLDVFLKEKYHRRSRQVLQTAIQSGGIQLRRRELSNLAVGRLKSSTQVIEGDTVCVESIRKPEPEVSFDYRILHEDESILVIDKPGNLPVHPAGRFFFNTLLIHLRTAGFTTREISAEKEYFLVHRIDRETSGIMVLTKTVPTTTDLTRQFAARETKKCYLAIVHGEVKTQEFHVNEPIGRDPTSPIGLKMAVIPEALGGQTADTAFRVREVRNGFSLVECFPRTGRQHQIRVHLEHAGHPIVGDKLYGLPIEQALVAIERRTFISPELEARLMLPRHALHAYSLEFKHPITGQRVTFQSDLPPDLMAFFKSR